MARQGKATITLLFEDGSIREQGSLVFPCGQAGFKMLLEKVVVESRKNVSAGAELEKQPEFVCLECGHKFYSAHAAEVAAFDDGCPDCNSSDIEVA